MKTYVVTFNGREHTVRIDAEGKVHVEGLEGTPDIRRLSQTEFSVMMGNRSIRVVASGDAHEYMYLSDGMAGSTQVESERSRLLRQYARSTGSSATNLKVEAPMPALIVRVEVEKGQVVHAGQGLIVLEAMKMENEIKAHQGGIVKEIYVTAGKPVEKGELLLVLE